MKYPKIRELKEAIKALFKGPITTKFPKKPHIPVDGFRGKPQPSQEGCIGCGACKEVCPVSAIKIKDEIKIENNNLISKSVRYLNWCYDECIFCGECARICTTKKENPAGVIMSKEFDLSTNKRDLLKSETLIFDLIICSNCYIILSTKKHLLYTSQKLGYKKYGNINLIHIDNYKNLKIQPLKQNTKNMNKRENLYEILCPKCRRITLLIDEYGKI